MEPSLLHILLITGEVNTQALIADLLAVGNANRAQQIRLKTLLVKNIKDGVEVARAVGVAPQSSCDLLLVDYPGEAAPQDIQLLRQNFPPCPLLILGDQKDALEDAASWHQAGADDYLLRHQLTSYWLRHTILRVTQGASPTSSSIPASAAPTAAPTVSLSTSSATSSSAYAQQLWRLLANLFNDMPVIVVVVSGPDHVFAYANPLCLQVLGHRDIIGKSIHQATPELVDQEIYTLLAEVYATGKIYSGREQVVWLQNDPSGPLQERYFTFVYAPIVVPAQPLVGGASSAGLHEKMIFVLAFEVTELVNLRRQWQEAHAQLDALFASAPLGLAFVDRELRFSRINPALANMNGLPADAHLGKTPDTLLPEVNAISTIMEQWRHILATGEPLIGVEVTGRTPAAPNEDHIWEEYWFPVWLNNEISGVGILAENITRRKHAEAEREQLLAVLAEERRRLDDLNQTLEKRVQERSLQVRTLASELTIAEQRERYRIAQILHDHIQQLLYGIDLRITLLAHNLPADQHDLLGESKEIIQEAIRATRTLAVELSPPVLQGEGLVRAFQWLAHQMKVIHSLQVILDVQEPPEVPPIEIRVLLLQSVRELLFNVVKHADIAVATVTLHQEDGNLVVRVVDQGRGFDLTSYSVGPRLPETFGLYSIRERLQLFGGNLKVDSAPGDGTRVVMIVPGMIVPRLS